MAATTTMDFFQNQEDARRKTSLLVAYYFLAVILIILAVYLAFIGIFTGLALRGGADFNPALLWKPRVFAWVVGITSAVVALGTLFKTIQLSRGGESVAVMMGGRPIGTNTTDPAERRVLNVIEEMSLASGVPVPKVFMLDNEPGINAFAAGLTPRDAVIGVTRGCVERLNRDELQGVIGHEFSHILNGDMRLNVRLLGVLNGILVIAIVGFHVMRSAARGGSRSRDKGGGALPVILFGLVVMAIGYIGVFFGRLIKSAVSRQREFLADAASIQFTRNPDGLAGALKKIGGLGQGGSQVRNENAEQVSHFFFADGLRQRFFNLFATHPPLDERIRRIDPAFSGIGRTPAGSILPTADDGNVAAFDGGRHESFAVEPGAVMASVGKPQAAHLAHAGAVMSALPTELVAAARDVSRAGAVVHALLLDGDPAIRATQLDGLEPTMRAAVQDLETPMRELNPEYRLSLLDLAVSTLRHMPAAGFEGFRASVEKMVAADQQVDLFEYALQRMMFRNLDPMFRRTRPPAVEYYSLGPLMDDCAMLLSCLAYWGADSTDVAESAFGSGVAKLDGGRELSIRAPDVCGLDSVAQSLDRLVRVSMPLRRQVLDACVSCVTADGKITLEESLLLRVVADSLDCPIPPVLPGRA